MVSVSTGHSLWIADSFTLLFNGGREGSFGMADYGGVDGVTLISFLGEESARVERHGGGLIDDSWATRIRPNEFVINKIPLPLSPR